MKRYIVWLILLGVSLIVTFVPFIRVSVPTNCGIVWEPGMNCDTHGFISLKDYLASKINNI